MKLETFKRLIKEAVREELQSELKKLEKRILNEINLKPKESVNIQSSQPTPSPSLPPEKKAAIREMFMSKMGGPLGDVLADTAINFTSEDLSDEEQVPSVLDNMNFLNKDYSGVLKAMEKSQKQRHNS